MEYQTLFEPVKIGPVEIKNHLAMPPMSTLRAGPGHRINDTILWHYLERARGGFGLIIIECTECNNKYASAFPGIMGLYDEGDLPLWTDLANIIHLYGAKAFVQVSLGSGRQGNTRSPEDNRPLVAPSPIPYEIKKGTAMHGSSFIEGFKGEMPREITEEEIEELLSMFGICVERILRSGFDGIELHVANGHLIQQFMSPLTNFRNDKYGGSFEGRLTLPLNLIKQTREQCGDKFALGARFPANEHAEGGLTQSDMKRIAPLFEQAGLDFIDISSGSYASFKHMMPKKEMAFLPEAQEIRKTVNIPIICANFYEPGLAEEALKQGKVDMISLGRSSLADPDWPNKVKDGREKEIIKCLHCGYCSASGNSGLGVHCKANKRMGLERFQITMPML